MTVAQPIAIRMKLKTRRWTRKEYYRLAALGFFEGQRVELIDGKICQMPALNNPHMVAHEKSRRALQNLFGPNYWIRYQGPLHILGSAPEPDLAVVPGGPDDYKSHPESALLVFEVSDTTLHIDRWKGGLYAAGGNKDYWILDLVNRRLEVRRDPVVDSTVKRFGHRYATVLTLGENQSASPLAVPNASVAVADLLP
jgi:Uma2 family endonuclease